MPKIEKGVPIRSVSRALAMLRQINRDNTMNMKELAEAVNVPYPTAVRLVQTLTHEGYVKRQENRRIYQVTDLAKSLSCGVNRPEDVVRVARPYILGLTEKTGWPISIARRVGAFMVIQDSTHTRTTQALSEYSPGFALPIYSSASGLLFLAHLEPEIREIQIKKLSNRLTNSDAGSISMLPEADDDIYDQISKDGYASYQSNLFTKDKGKTSSLAVPIMDGEKFFGTLALVFFVAAMSIDEAIEKYAKLLKDTSLKISEDLEDEVGFGMLA